MQSTRLNIVFLVSRFPFPLTKGDRLRAYYQIKELSKKHNVHLIALSDTKIKESDKKELEPYCASIHIQRLSKPGIYFRLIWTYLFSDLPLQVSYFFSGKNKKKIVRVIDDINPNIVYCQLVRTSEYCKEITHIPKYIDLMDAMSAGMQRRMENSSFYERWIWKEETHRLKKYEHQVLAYFEGVSIISAADQSRIINYNNPEITVVPNGVDTTYFRFIEERPSKTLLFTGNMSYPPNIESALYLATVILPIVHQKDPHVKLVIAGAHPTKKIRSLSSNRITVTGWTEDIRKYYDEAAVFMAPMLIGSGLQNKLLEAMACGIPCITSTLANNSLGAKENSEILIGHSANEYADLAQELLNNKSRAQEIGKMGYTFVKNQYNWNSSVLILEMDFNDIVKTT